MTTDFYIKTYDTRPLLQVPLTDGEGNSVDLDGASVVFNMDNRISRAAAVVVAASTGLVTYNWTADDTSLPGVFDAEFEVTHADGKIEKFPRDGYIKVVIERRASLLSAYLVGPIESANALTSKVVNAFGQTTSDRFLDLSGDGVVTAQDTSIAVTTINVLGELREAQSAAVTSFALAPAAIQDMIDGVTTTVPVALLAGKWILLDLDDSGTVDANDITIANRILAELGL